TSLLYYCAYHRDLHSFPTRRSSDLKAYKNRKKREKKSYLVDGVIYRSVTELAKAYGLAPALVYNRMRDNGWTPERSVKEGITERSEEHTSELQSRENLVCRLLLEKK